MDTHRAEVVAEAALHVLADFVVERQPRIGERLLDLVRHLFRERRAFRFALHVVLLVAVARVAAATAARALALDHERALLQTRRLGLGRCWRNGALALD